MAKHTPGPWKVRKEWHGEGKEVYPDRKVSVGQPCEVAVVSGIYDECAANARLIAAAPDMLEALKHAVDWLNAACIAETMPVQQQARAAIAKAEGTPL